MSTEQEVAAHFMSAHPEYLVCDLNGRLIEAYLADRKLAFTTDNLEQAYADISDQLAKKPVKVVAKTLDEVAPVPSYFGKFGKLETVADFQRLSPQETRKLATGPDAEAYRARLLAVQQPGYTPKPASPAAEHGTLDKFGLPTVPGIEPEFLPNNKKEIDAMGRNFGLLLRSKKAGVGKAFEARVKAILKKEGR